MKQRILFLTPSLSRGGAETQLLKIARHLKSRESEVMIISLKSIKEFDIDFKREGIQILFLNKWLTNPISNFRKLYQAVQKFKPEVTIAFMFIAIIFARLLKLRINFHLISTIRISEINRKWLIPFKLTSGLDDSIVYNSQASKHNFERKKLVSKPGVVINNAITLPHPDKISSLKVDKQFVWACIAHFRWNKDYMTLFKALSLIKDKSFRLDIVGNLNNELWPFKVVEDLGIEEHIRFLGLRQNATDYLRDADAFVLSSFSEGMPNALLEAMAYNKPVVVTDIDCNQELVNGSGCGFLSKQGNEHDLAEKMILMMEATQEQRQKLGQNGRQHIERYYSEAQIMKEWTKIINTGFTYSLVTDSKTGKDITVTT